MEPILAGFVHRFKCVAIFTRSVWICGIFHDATLLDT